ncbi:helix-turn-helix domain-containing protein [Mucilaginibacter sp. CAU 1740]|uniref:helix-turn-helix domain-containing protein n=1 Tax=Mucilaginibacter sp. CAU 1740 TaxID=3140365 RepID=UPI00325A79F7
MPPKIKHIPVNILPAGTREGIFIARASFNASPDIEETGKSHRDNGHLFILQEAGTTHIEIDFQKHKIEASSVIYIHPSQVHRLILFENATVSSCIITAENLNPANLQLLESLNPVDALALNPDALTIISETATLCIKLAERKQERLYDAILKESCNVFVSLIASQYLEQAKPCDSRSRFEVVTKAFKSLLENSFASIKSPATYAERLNISTPYLNECVKTATGFPVSYHIQQRVILEAKRLLYHSDKSVKEIAVDLGYDDYSYFTRLFVKLTGITPIAFRDKNLD